MNKEKLYINITFFGLGLFLFTFVFHFDLPLKTMICLGIGYLFIMPLLLAKTKLKNLFEHYGPVRYASLMLFGLTMFALPIKMYLRWIFNLKYIVAIPEWFFNI